MIIYLKSYSEGIKLTFIGDSSQQLMSDLATAGPALNQRLATSCAQE